MSKTISSIGLIVKLIIILATVGCATTQEPAKQRLPEKVLESSTHFYPVIKPKITDKKIDVPLSINLRPTLYRPDPYDPMKNVYNILAIYNKNAHIRITTDLSATGAQSLKGKDGFTVVTYPVTVNYSPSTPVKPKILSHTAVFSPVVEKLAGVSLADSELFIPKSHSNRFVTEVRDKGTPLGEDSYGFNFYGVKAEMKFTLDNSGEIISAELEYLDINSSYFNASYTSSEGKKLNPRIISLKDFMNKTVQLRGESRQTDAAKVASEQSPGIPKYFLGKWIAVDNKDHYVLVTGDSIRWERGDIEGPDIVPMAKCTVSADKQSVSFPVRSSVGAMVGGKIVRGTVIVTMTVSNGSLTIAEGTSDTIKDSHSGFAFQQTGGTKHVFRKVQEK